MALKNMVQFCSVLKGKDNFCKNFFFLILQCSCLFSLVDTQVSTWLKPELFELLLKWLAQLCYFVHHEWSDSNGEWAVTGEEFAQWLPVLWVYYTNCWLLQSCVKWTLINPAMKVLLHLLNLAHYEKCKQLSQSTLCVH